MEACTHCYCRVGMVGLIVVEGMIGMRPQCSQTSSLRMMGLSVVVE